MLDGNHIEEWRPVVGLEGWYSVSNNGRVRREKTGPATWAGRMLQLCHDGHGYFRVTLHTGVGKIKRQKVHRMVAEAFIVGPPDGNEVNHLNGIKDDNRVENLEWTTHVKNMRHSVGVLGNKPGYVHGEQHGMSKLSVADIRAIRDRRKCGEKIRRIATDYEISDSHVSQIVLRKIWKIA